MARIRELQALDPNILLLRTPVEAKEFEQLEVLEANTKKALEKKEAKQIAKQETPVGLPDPKTMEVEEKQPVETPVGLPDPKTMEVEEKQPVETPVGLPDPKTTEKEQKQPAKTETTPQKVEQKPIATETKPAAKPEPKAKEEEKSLPIAEVPQKTETSPEKKVEPTQAEPEKKEIPSDAEPEKGLLDKWTDLEREGEAIEEENEEIKAKLAKVFKNIAKAERDNANGKLSEDEPEEEEEPEGFTFKIRPNGDVESSYDGKYMKIDVVMAIDGTVKSSSVKLQKNEHNYIGISKNEDGGHTVEGKTGSEDNNLSGQIVYNADGTVKEVKGAGTAKLDKNTNVELSLSSEHVKAGLTRKYEFQERKWSIPVAHCGILSLAITAAISANGSFTATHELKKIGASDDAKRWQYETGLTAKFEGKASLGLSVTALETLRVEINANAYLRGQGTAKLTVIGADTPPTIATEETVISLSAGVSATIGASHNIQKKYQDLGGDPKSLEFTYDFGEIELLKITLPNWSSKDGFAGEITKYEYGAGLKAVEEIMKPYVDIVKKIIAILQALVEFFANIFANIGKFILACASALFNALDNALNPEKAKALQERAVKDAKFNKAVEKAANELKTKKDTALAMEAAGNDAAKQEEIFRGLVMKHPAVQKIYHQIYTNNDSKGADNTLDQMTAKVSGFTLQVGGKLEFGGKATLTLSAESDTTFPIEMLNLGIMINDGSVYNVAQAQAANVTKGKWSITSEVNIPSADYFKQKGINLQDPANKWYAFAFLNMLGDDQDKHVKIPITVKKPKAPAIKEAKPIATNETLIKLEVKDSATPRVIGTETAPIPFKLALDMRQPNAAEKGKTIQGIISVSLLCNGKKVKSKDYVMPELKWGHTNPLQAAIPIPTKEEALKYGYGYQKGMEMNGIKLTEDIKVASVWTVHATLDFLGGVGVYLHAKPITVNIS